MKFKKYYISNKDGKSNCVVRTFCKMYNNEYDDVYNDLINISKEINSESFNDIEVFETYMKRHNTNKIDYKNDIKIKDLILDNDSYIVFCWDKKDYYHMFPIINGTIYDKDNKCLDLYVISIYKGD